MVTKTKEKVPPQWIDGGKRPFDKRSKALFHVKFELIDVSYATIHKGINRFVHMKIGVDRIRSE